jgi:Protein of unknown function (DUF2975)
VLAVLIVDKETAVSALSTNPASSKLAKPLGQGSLPSSLATALKVARILLSIAFAFAAVVAVIGIPVSVLVASHVVSATVLNGPGYNMLAMWTIALILAEVFRQGTQLREETELTV